VCLFVVGVGGRKEGKKRKEKNRKDKEK